jgi:hypothetical protein
MTGRPGSLWKLYGSPSRPDSTRRDPQSLLETPISSAQIRIRPAAARIRSDFASRRSPVRSRLAPFGLGYLASTSATSKFQALLTRWVDIDHLPVGTSRKLSVEGAPMANATAEHLLDLLVVAGIERRQMSTPSHPLGMGGTLAYRS